MPAVTGVNSFFLFLPFVSALRALRNDENLNDREQWPA
jgi:hypothetical protein